MLTDKVLLQKIANANKKPALRHRPVKDFLGVSHAGFKQQYLIDFVNDGHPKDRLSYFWQGKVYPQLRKEGLCAAFLFLWYEKLRLGSNLLNSTYEALFSNDSIIRNIHYFNHIQAQCGYGSLNFPRDIDIEKMKKGSLLSSGCDEIYPKMGFLDCAEGDAIAFQYYENGPDQVDQFETYLNKMKDTERAYMGLHTIGFSTKRFGHMIGWTPLEKGFLLFDANQGESLFENFEQLKQYICGYLKRVQHKNLYVSIDVENFYFQEDLDALTVPESFSKNKSCLL